MIADTVRLYFIRRHAGYPEKKCYSVCFNCGKNCGFSLLDKNTQYPLIFKAIFGFIWILILCHGLCSFLHMKKLTWAFRMYLQQHRKRQDMTHVTLKLMKVNLPAHEVCTTISMNKKEEIISFTVIAPSEVHPPVVKNVVLTLFQGRFSL